MAKKKKSQIHKSKIKEVIQTASEWDIFKVIAIALSFASAGLTGWIIYLHYVIGQQEEIIWKLYQALQTRSF